MKKLTVFFVALLGLAFGQNLFADLPTITPVNAGAIKIAKVQQTGLAWMLPHLEKYAKFLHSKPTATCDGIDAYTMTGGFYQIEQAHYELQGIALKVSEANNPVYSAFAITRGTNKYLVAFFLGAAKENPTKLITVGRCKLKP